MDPVENEAPAAESPAASEEQVQRPTGADKVLTDGQRQINELMNIGKLAGGEKGLKDTVEELAKVGLLTKTTKANSKEKEKPADEGSAEGAPAGKKRPGRVNAQPKEEVEVDEEEEQVDGEEEKNKAGKKKKPDAESADDDEENEEVDEEEDEDEETENPFLKKKNKDAGKGKGLPENLKLDTTEDIDRAIKKFFGKDYDIKNFVKGAAKWRDQAKTAQESNAKAENLQKFFNSLPDDAQQMIIDIGDGKDYRSEFVSRVGKSIDYSKKFEDHDIKSLAKKLDPDSNTTDEDAEDYIDLSDDKDSAVKAYKRNLKSQYDSKKASTEKENASMATKRADQKRAWGEQVDTQVSAFVKTLPAKPTKDQVATVTQILNTGSLDSLLYDKDGKMLKDAPGRLYFALFGNKQISQLAAALDKQLSATEETIEKGSANPPGTRKKQPLGTEQSMKGAEAVLDFFDTASGKKKKKP